MAQYKPTKVVAPRIVQPGDSGRAWLWLLVVIVLGVWTWQVFEFGRQRAGFDVSHHDEIVDSLEDRIAELEAERDQLRQSSVRFERTTQIDKAAVSGVKSEVKALQVERADLKREVAFLKSLVSGGSSKLSLDDFRLVDNGGRSYGVEVTLSKTTEDDSTIAGQVVIRLRGKQDGRDKTLDMQTATAGSRTNIGIKFKNFQKLTTDLKLPEGFEPEAIEVAVQPLGKEFKSFEQVYDWPEPDA